MTGRVRPLAAGALATLFLLLPALWNGYIFFYYDSVDYVYLPFNWELPAYRTAGYAVTTLLGRLTGSLWTVALFQAVVAVFSIREALRVFAPGSGDGMPLAVTGAVTALTGLPWFAGQLMPDAFTGPVVLAVLALAFGWEDLPRGRRLLLLGVATVGGGAHTSHLGLMLGLAGSLWCLRLLLRRSWPEFRPRAWPIALAAVLTATFVVTTHWISQGRPFLTQPTHMLWLARMVQDGTAKELLDEVCPTQAEEYRLCAFRDQFPETANDFLWHGRSIILRLGGWEGLRDEAKSIFHESLRRHPGHHLKVMAELTLQQLVEFRTGDGVIPLDWLVGDTLEEYYNDEYVTFLDSRQEDGISFNEINLMQVPVLAASQLALFPVLVWGWRRRDRRTFGLATALLLALLGNAFICGALSNPNHRYQSRLAWVAVMVVMVAGRKVKDDRDRAGPVPR